MTGAVFTEGQQWEYKSLRAKSHNDEVMNDLGADGWELVGIDQMILFFKRPVTDREPKYEPVLGPPPHNPGERTSKRRVGGPRRYRTR